MTDTTDVTSEQLLAEAADYIEKYGWMHPSLIGNVMARAFRCCAQVAVFRVAMRHAPLSGAGELCDPALELLVSRIAALGFEWDRTDRLTMEKVWRWNDAPDRTEVEVLAVLRG